MKTIAIIQARTASTRLPNKIFLKLSEKPLIWHVCQRVIQSGLIDQVVLASTNSPYDDKLVNWAKSEDIKTYRGSEENVLSRFYEAAKYFNADVIVRITADDPFKDPQIIDKVLNVFLEKELDFAFNNFPPTYPEGLDVEVFSFAALKQAFMNATDNFEKEHVTQYFFRNITNFRHENISNEVDFSNFRWTIDTQEDYKMAVEVYNSLYKEGQIFCMNEIFSLLDKRPEIKNINDSIARSTMYNNLN